MRHVVPAVIKPARTLWNQIIGFLFLSLGAIFGLNSLRYAYKGNTLGVILAGIATAIMAYHGVSSFLRARKISRS